ncbi:MAG: ammonium transporter [Planctomycetaceae bacterium]|nr:ammonium transporter [Planctomycetaceae bacterium]
MIVWESFFDSGNIAWLLFIALLAPTFCLGGLWLMVGSRFAEAAKERLKCQSPLIVAILALAWGGWIYTLGFGPSWGTIPPPATETAGPMTGIAEAMAYADSLPDETLKMGRGGYFGGLEYMLLEKVLPVAGSHGPNFPTKASEHGVPSLVVCFLQFSVFLIALFPLVLVWSEKFSGIGLAVLLMVWSTLVYAPVAHAVAGDGWLFYRGTLDASAGLIFLAVGCSLFLLRSETATWDGSDSPSGGVGALSFCLGILLLQGGSIHQADGRAVLAVVNSLLGISAGLLSWSFCSSFLWKRLHTENLTSGVLVATSAMAACSAYVMPQSAVIIGVVAGAIGNIVDRWLKAETQATRMLASALCCGSVIGLLGVGIFATTGAGGNRWDGREITGLLQGDFSQIQHQLLAIGAVGVWSALMTFLLTRIANAVFPGSLKLSPATSANADAEPLAGSTS